MLLPLKDSYRAPLSSCERSPAPPAATGYVTVMFRRDTPSIVYDTFDAYAAKQGLICTERHKRTQTMKFSGPIAALEKTFAVDLHHCVVDGQAVRVREGHISVPEELHEHVLAVLGLDTRPVAAPKISFNRAVPRVGEVPLYATQVANAYHFPSDADGTGTTIAVIELGGGYSQADIDKYAAKLGIKAPVVTAIPIDGAGNYMGGDADGEVALDIQVIAAVAPKADILVYFAPNTDAGFVDAVSAAAHTVPPPAAISISWGGPENAWTVQGRAALDQAIQNALGMNVNVFVASGDDGSSDGEDGCNVDFPASSPNAIACGGTTLQLKANGHIETQFVWNDGSSGGAGGGGVSQFYSVPAYQSNIPNLPHAPNGFNGRAVPDIAGNADPNTGYLICLRNQWQVVGGTSAVAPLFAGLCALYVQKLQTTMPDLHQFLYTAPAACFWDVRTGDNTTPGDNGYPATAGFDCATGLGTVLGNAFYNFLTSTNSPAVQPLPSEEEKN